jgi:hypothetical protein
MMKIGGIPVKTRVPLAVWLLAGLLTLVSLASSMVHHIANMPSSNVVSACASEPTTSGVLHASLN